MTSRERTGAGSGSATTTSCPCYRCCSRGSRELACRATRTDGSRARRGNVNRVPEITDTDLRERLDEVLLRVQAGEAVTVTSGARPVAELTPVPERRWVSGPRLLRVWTTPAPKGLRTDLADFTS